MAEAKGNHACFPCQCFYSPILLVFWFSLNLLDKYRSGKRLFTQPSWNCCPLIYTHFLASFVAGIWWGLVGDGGGENMWSDCISFWSMSVLMLCKNYQFYVCRILFKSNWLHNLRIPRYPVTCNVYIGYHVTRRKEHGLSNWTVDTPLAKGRGLSL